MAITNNHIQLFRNSVVFDNREAAISRLNSFTSANVQDGTPVLARYTQNGATKTLLALFYVTGSTVKYDIVGDSADINSAISALETKLVGGASDGYKTLKDLEDKIVKLNGDDTTDGSVAKAVKDAVEALDVAEIKEAGKAIVAVSEQDGKVSAKAGDIDAVHVIQDAAVTGEGAKDAVTVKRAIDDLRTTVAANKVVAEDASIVVGTKDGETSLKVGVDAEEKVLSANGALKTTIALAEVPADQLGTNVAKAYQLQGKDGVKLGTVQIEIPKDTSLNKVYLGSIGDTVDAKTGAVTSATTTDPQSLNFVYHLQDGTYSLVPVDVSKFLTESEFKDGLVVADSVVKVKVDTASEKFLSVGADGVKLSGVQAAIDAAKASATTVVDGTGHISVSESTDEKDGHKKYTVSDNVNGGNVKLDGYVDTVKDGNPTATDTVNQAISKLFNLIQAGGQDASNIAAELDKVETAIGLAEDGTKVANNGNYTKGAATIEAEIAALDTQVKTNADAIATNKVVAGDGITAVEATGAGTTVAAKINTDSGLAFNKDSKAIEIASIDAGTY